MKKSKKKIFKYLQSVLLTTSIIVSSAAAYTSAATTSSDSSSCELKKISRVVKSNNSGLLRYAYEDEKGNTIDFDSSAKASSNSAKKGAGILPSSYSLVDNNLTTSIKDQGATSSCWAFSAVKAMESNSIKKGMYDTDTADFSENHLTWFTYSLPTDKSDSLYGDGMFTTPSFFPASAADAYDIGGHALIAIFTLAKWSGAELEGYAPFAADTESQVKIMANSMKNKEANRYNSYAHLQNAECYDNADISTIKQALMDKGALNISMYYDTCGFESDSYTACSYYQTRYSEPLKAQEEANHCVTIVGWDDNYSKNNFKNKPSSDGAWLIANSYGPESNNNGYFWLSYKEPSIGEIYSMDVEPTNNYDNIYQYDGAGCEEFLYYPDADITGANVFTNNSNTVQYLKSVSFYTKSDKQKYTIKIYKNLKGNTPSTGTLVNAATTTGTETYNGYHTIPLKSSCKINPGEKFAVAITYKYDSSSGNRAYLPIEGESYSDYDDVTHSFSAKANQSFTYSSSTKQWTDSFKEGNNNICIKAFTVNSSEEPDILPETTRNAKITLSRSSITLGKNESFKLNYNLINASTDASVTFKSSNTSVAKVSSTGKITASGVGKATITALTSDGASSRITVTVKKAPSRITTTPSGKKSIKKGNYFNIKYYLPAGSASFKITYSSSNTKIAKVTNTGKVTGLKKGIANITIKTYNNKKSVIKLTVK